MENELSIIKLIVSSYMTNCYVIFNENKEAFIIDPGDQADFIITEVEKRNLKVQGIIVTHGHPDHFEALESVKNHFNVKSYIGKKEKDYLKMRIEMLGLKFKENLISTYLEEGDTIEFSGDFFKVIETPGHTPGGICLLYKDLLFAGDTLFKGSIGRTDFVGGDYPTIVKSLKKLKKLPDETIVLSGHGDESNIKMEKISNPFLIRIGDD